MYYDDIFKELNKLDESQENKLEEVFETHSNLNLKLFDENILREDVRKQLIKIADMFVDSIKEDQIPIKVYDYWLVGSNAAYNYNDESDIDVHIIVDINSLGLNPYLISLLYNYIKSSFNDKYDIKVKGHEVELYLEDIETTAVTNGIYSLKLDKWIKEPTPTEVMSYNVEETELWDDWYERYQNICEREAEQFLDDLYIMRKMSLANDGEFGTGNLVFKEFRNRGYIQELKNKKYKYKSDELTLEKLEEDILEEDWYKVDYTIDNEKAPSIYVFAKDTAQVNQALNDAMKGLYRRDKEDSMNHKIVDELFKNSKNISNISLSKQPSSFDISKISLDFILTLTNRKLRKITNDNVVKELKDPSSTLHKNHYEHLTNGGNSKILVHHKDGGEGRDFDSNYIIASYNEVDLAHIAHKYCHMKKNVLKKGDTQSIPLADPATGSNYLLTLTLS